MQEWRDGRENGRVSLLPQTPAWDQHGITARIHLEARICPTRRQFRAPRHPPDGTEGCGPGARSLSGRPGHGHARNARGLDDRLGSRRFAKREKARLALLARRAFSQWKALPDQSTMTTALCPQSLQTSVHAPTGSRLRGASLFKNASGEHRDEKVVFSDPHLGHGMDVGSDCLADMTYPLFPIHGITTSAIICRCPAPASWHR